LAPSPGRAGELTAALSNHLVGITTGFTGSEVLVFGAVSGEGDIIIVARGPENSEVVRRKARKAGIWVNDTEMIFENVPGFYAVASSRPLADILSDAAGEEFEIGVNNVILEPKDSSNAAKVDGFRDALVRNKQRIDLYSEGWAPVRFLGTLLFRSDLDIPSNAPVGSYTIAVHLVRDGVITDSSISPLSINRIGFEARVFDFAHRNSFAYGVLAILIAAMAGWLANWVFRKG
jgi:uncharacterized protein (TIGR02186 family)